MCIYRSLKHKHGVAWTAICYPAAVNSQDISNSTGLSLILAYEKHFEKEGVNHHVTAHPTSAILHLLCVTSDTIKQATQPRDKMSEPKKYASEEGRDWKKYWDGVQKLYSHSDLCWITTKKNLCNRLFPQKQFPQCSHLVLVVPQFIKKTTKQMFFDGQCQLITKLFVNETVHLNLNKLKVIT